MDTARGNIMATNKYAGRCYLCGHPVPAFGGLLVRKGRRWVVHHSECGMVGESAVVVTSFAGGGEVYRNRRGRCEDAPCCGCCSG